MKMHRETCPRWSPAVRTLVVDSRPVLSLRCPAMNYLDEQKRAMLAAPVMLAILEEPGRFHELFAEYRRLDGPIDARFLEYVPQAREVWREMSAAPEKVAQLLALPVAFQEGVFFGLKRDARIEILQQCLAQGADKDVKKRLKRLLYELKKEGVAVADRPRKAPLYRKEQVEASDAISSCVSISDPANERILIVNQPAPHGYRMLHLFERHGQAVVDFTFEETSRKKLRTFLRELQDTYSIPLYEIPDDFAFYLLQRLKTRMAETGNQPPSGFISALAQMNLPPNEPTEHPYHRLVDSSAVLERLGDLEACTMLHDEKELAFLMLPPDAVSALQLAIQDLQTSNLTIDQNQKQEQIQLRFNRIVDQFFDVPRRRIYIDRLQDAAYLLARRNATVQAVAAAALALYLENAERPASQVTFFRIMLLKAVDIMAGPRPAEKTEKSSEGGIIL